MLIDDIAKTKSLSEMLGKALKALPKDTASPEDAYFFHHFVLGNKQHMIPYEGERDIVLKAQDELRRLEVFQMKFAHLLKGLRDHGAERLYEIIMKEPMP